ncbi:MAG: class I SAM-dependent methyltransferase [Gammaproteobacteria bacterium]|nr:class I SAM-dependent methyltransferase [Gammaproteobacteria bacterium]
MTEKNSLDSEQARYWNEGGGRRWAANIERVERMLQPLAARLVEHAAALPGERVIDVGCGGGLTSKALAEAVGATGAVLGLDVSSIILEVARARFANVANLRFVHGDAGSMALEQGDYDLITSRFGVMFFPDATGAFAHLHSALKRSGRLKFICWRALKLNPWMAIPVKAAFEILPRPEPLPPNAPGPFGLADESYLREVLTRAGFRDIEITPNEVMLDLGTLEDAVEQMTRMGPPAQAFDEATAAMQAEVLRALRAAFESFVTAGRVQLISATWLVSARP